jgi:SNF2 family DNA or RNA helicase
MPLAEIHEDAIRVDTAWNEKELVKAIPGSRWNAVEKMWTVPLTMVACSQLKGQFKDTLQVGPQLTQWVWNEYNRRVKPALEQREKFAFNDSGFVIDSRLYDFQQWGASWLIAAGSGLLCDEMGTGKTIQVLAAMAHLDELDSTSVLPALVVSPNSVKMNWAKETATWLPQATPYVLTGTASVRAKLIAAAAKDPTALVITNFESTHRLSRLSGYGSIRLLRCRECDPKYGVEGLKPAGCEVHPRPLNQIPFHTVIVDEAHRIKDPKAKQTRAVWALGSGDAVQRRWALTGTPLANDPSDLWSIMHFVTPDEYPTKSKFVDLYCLLSWNVHGGIDVVGINPERKEEFYKIFDPRFRRMPKALVLSQLPPKIRQRRMVEMTPKQRKAYDEVASRLLTRLDDGSILVAKSDLSAQIRLLQLASSYCLVDYHDAPHDPTQWTVELTEPSPKLDELMAVLDELGDRPVVVAAEQRRLIELACVRLDKASISYGLITGAVDAYDRQVALESFQAGRLRVLLFTLKAGGTGLTMTAADTIIFLQRSWSMIDNKQAEDRVHRIGSEIHESINIIDIVTEDTVEETQIARLYDKARRLDEITRDRATLLKAGRSIVHLDDEEGKIMNSFLGQLE